MRTGRFLAIGAAVLTSVLVNGGAGGSVGDEGTGSDDYCVPRMAVSPTSVTAGASITLMSEDVCEVALPANGWGVGAGHVGDGASLVTVSTTESFDGSFEVTLLLPEDFPGGEGYVGIDDWDYSTCPDDASYAAPSSSFKVSR